MRMGGCLAACLGIKPHSDDTRLRTSCFLFRTGAQDGACESPTKARGCGLVHDEPAELVLQGSIHTNMETPNTKPLDAVLVLFARLDPRPELLFRGLGLLGRDVEACQGHFDAKLVGVRGRQDWCDHLGAACVHWTGQCLADGFEQVRKGVLAQKLANILGGAQRGPQVVVKLHAKDYLPDERQAFAETLRVHALPRNIYFNSSAPALGPPMRVGLDAIGDDLRLDGTKTFLREQAKQVPQNLHLHRAHVQPALGFASAREVAARQVGVFQQFLLQDVFHAVQHPKDCGHLAVGLGHQGVQGREVVQRRALAEDLFNVIDLVAHFLTVEDLVPYLRSRINPLQADGFRQFRRGLLEAGLPQGVELLMCELVRGGFLGAAIRQHFLQALPCRPHERCIRRHVALADVDGHEALVLFIVAVNKLVACGQQHLPPLPGARPAFINNGSTRSKASQVN